MIRKTIVNEIHRSARKNFDRRSVLLKGIDDLWQADLIDIKNFKNVNKGFKFILVVIDCFSKYAWALPMKTKTKSEITNAFYNLILSHNRKPVNLQTDRGTEFYNDCFQKLMKRCRINHYSSFSCKKASIVERLIRTLKNKLHNKFTLNGNKKWLGEPLQTVMYDYNNTRHSSIRCKPVDVSHCNTLTVLRNIINSQYKSKKIKPRYKVGDYVRISKYKSIFDKGYMPNWSTELFNIKAVNNTSPVTYFIEDLKNQPILGCFYEKELQKTLFPHVYLVEKVLKKKGNKLFVKWLGLNEKENSWINKKDLC